ncbi:unnamed protein product [Adineta steineri]|uniref:Carrier domain-containing protein n=1 Tax=Adineta steineri TaxID=433720 RepID=A0A815QWD0_9BILA|nr:unnamed protein product [Adineta steineri]CAF1635150.1 unnamed protein product [Adineta steineri]
MFQLRSDCSFHVTDFAGLLDHISPLIGIMLKEAIDLFVQRELCAVEPTVTYEPSQVIEALLRCNSDQVMNKTVIRITLSDQPLTINKKQSNSLLKVVSDSTMFSPEVCNQGTILISGSFGGLGLTMSRWMIEQRGVKHIALMSRRTLIELEQPSNLQYDEWLKLKRIIKESNVDVDVVQADVINFEQVYNLIERFNKSCYPIRGIIHSAVVAEDRTLNNLTQEHLSLVLPAKVRGAWYLHQATQLLHAPIHFFIMFSSIRNHLLGVAFAGYNAGNQFLDALAHYRFEKLNLPALSISLPAVSGAGMFHRHKEMLSTLKETQGFELMPTITVFELIECFHQTQKICPCPVIFTVNWKTLHRNYPTLATSYLRKIVDQRYKEMKFDQISSSSSGKNNSTESTMNKKETIIERTQSTVARLLGAASVDRIVIDRSLVSQDMDSLAAVSLYNWLGQETGIYIPLVDLLQGLSVETIATLVYSKLNEKEQTTSSATKEHDSDFDLVNRNEAQYSNTSTYTDPSSIKRIRSILFTLIEQHSVLRTVVRFNPQSNQIEQYIQAATDTIYSFQHSRNINTSEELDRLLTKESTGKIFDFKKGKVLSFHHIAFDNSSLMAFIKAFKQIDLANEQQPILSAPQYIDFALYEQTLLADTNIDSKMNKALPHENKIDQIHSGRAYSTAFSFDQNIVDAMISFASSNDLTMFSLSLACYYVFLYKLINMDDDDLCVGSVIANRTKQKMKDMIGMFVNLVPYRMKMEANNSFEYLIRKIQQLCSDVLKHSCLPYQHIINLQDQQNYQVLPSTLFQYESLVSSVTTKNNPEVGAIEENSVPIIYFDRDRSHDNVIHEPIYKLSIVLPTEQEFIHQMNNTNISTSYSWPNTVHECFIQQAQLYPQKLAHELDEQSLTYSELLYSVYYLTNY